MTNEEAEALLAQLSQHYRDPVMTLTQFCNTMRKWVDCIEQGCEERDKDYQHGEAYVKQLRHILTDIAKSDLLGRLFYAREGVRTIKCPEHKGHWSGIEGLHHCPHGCGLTGWLPNP